MLNALLTGAISLASLVVSLFFLRFWKSTKDRFFLYFALSFVLEAASRVLLDITAPHEDTPAYYLVRLAAYALILLAIIEKNRNRNKR